MAPARLDTRQTDSAAALGGRARSHDKNLQDFAGMTDHDRDARDLRFLARIDQGWPVKRAAQEAGFSVSMAFKLLRETKG